MTNQEGSVESDDLPAPFVMLCIVEIIVLALISYVWILISNYFIGAPVCPYYR